MRLINELGGLGNSKKIKSREEFGEHRQKIKELGRLVHEFEKEVIDFFDAKGFYPCRDPMQIALGRRKYQTSQKNLKKLKTLLLRQEITDNQVIKEVKP